MSERSPAEHPNVSVTPGRQLATGIEQRCARSLVGALQPRAGQGTIEFALAMSPFLFVVFAIVEFGWAIYGYNTVQHAAYEAARRAMVLNRPASQYQASGNSSGTGLVLAGCSSSILGTVQCQIGVLPSSRITADISVPTAAASCTGQPTPCFLSSQNVPAGQTVSVTVHYAYQPLVAYPFTTMSLNMTGFAQAQTE